MPNSISKSTGNIPLTVEDHRTISTPSCITNGTLSRNSPDLGQQSGLKTVRSSDNEVMSVYKMHGKLINITNVKVIRTYQINIS